MKIDFLCIDRSLKCCYETSLIKTYSVILKVKHIAVGYITTVSTKIIFTGIVIFVLIFHIIVIYYWEIYCDLFSYIFVKMKIFYFWSLFMYCYMYCMLVFFKCSKTKTGSNFRKIFRVFINSKRLICVEIYKKFNILTDFLELQVSV